MKNWRSSQYYIHDQLDNSTTVFSSCKGFYRLLKIILTTRNKKISLSRYTIFHTGTRMSIYVLVLCVYTINFNGSLTIHFGYAILRIILIKVVTEQNIYIYFPFVKNSYKTYNLIINECAF